MIPFSPILVWTGLREFDKFLRQQWPEKIFAGITDETGNFLPVLNENESGREYDGGNMAEIFGTLAVDIDTAQRRAFSFLRIRIGRTYLGMPALTPFAGRTFEHHQFGAFRTGCETANGQDDCETPQHG